MTPPDGAFFSQRQARSWVTLSREACCTQGLALFPAPWGSWEQNVIPLGYCHLGWNPSKHNQIRQPSPVGKPECSTHQGSLCFVKSQATPIMSSVVTTQNRSSLTTLFSSHKLTFRLLCTSLHLIYGSFLSQTFHRSLFTPQSWIKNSLQLNSDGFSSGFFPAMGPWAHCSFIAFLSGC